MQKIVLKQGVSIPRLGQGTWYLGDNKGKRAEEIATLRRGIELGMTLIDTAEMYGAGRSESLVGEAIKPFAREELFLVSKVLPSNAGRRAIARSCENSLSRLGTEYLDSYLLHWRGGVPLEETVTCMMELLEQGKIRSFGVSNLDTNDMEELFRVKDGDTCVLNQVLYHLGSRGTEYSLQPWLKEHGVAMMAYCPLAQAGALQQGLLRSEAVNILAQEKQADVFQILLAFALHDENVIAIPKSSSIEHVESNAAARAIKLTDRDLALLSRDFPAPTRKMPLDIE